MINFQKNILCYMEILIGFISSCDPSLSHKRIIQNNTDKNLTLVVVNAGDEISDLRYDSLYYDTIRASMIMQFEILANSAKTLIDFNTIGVVNDIKNCLIDCEQIGFDTTSFIVNKDLSIMSNWTKSVEEEQNNGAGTVTCYFKIENTDILPME
ncbi:hypothetical protein OAO55_02450 [Bacteroidales bacterium]|nr:hypothetical protein [Bacteroidales bacterium]